MLWAGEYGSITIINSWKNFLFLPYQIQFRQDRIGEVGRHLGHNLLNLRLFLLGYK
jgi:hypothetical protein